MRKLLAIDGMNIVRRVYEANPDPDSPKKAEAAVRNSFSSFRNVLTAHEPTHVIAAFDFGGRTWRHALYDRYREGRKPMPEDLQERLPKLHQWLRDAKVQVVSIPDAEADDVIATAVMRWLTEHRGEAVVVSTDKDLHALIEYGAQVWDYFKSEWHDRSWVEKKFGVTPGMLPDFLALVGDRVDGIPGVERVGAKTAAKLLQSYRNLEGVMDGAGILKDSLGERLRKGKDLAFLARELVRLKMDVKLGVTWNMLAYSPK